MFGKIVTKFQFLEGYSRKQRRSTLQTLYSLMIKSIISSMRSTWKIFEGSSKNWTENVLVGSIKKWFQGGRGGRFFLSRHYHHHHLRWMNWHISNHYRCLRSRNMHRVHLLQKPCLLLGIIPFFLRGCKAEVLLSSAISIFHSISTQSIIR